MCWPADVEKQQSNHVYSGHMAVQTLGLQERWLCHPKAQNVCHLGCKAVTSSLYSHQSSFAMQCTAEFSSEEISVVQVLLIYFFNLFSEFFFNIMCH